MKKIIPTLLREGEKDTKIIIIDDDIIYGKDFIETIIEEGYNNKVNYCYELLPNEDVMFYYISSVLKNKLTVSFTSNLFSKRIFFTLGKMNESLRI